MAQPGGANVLVVDDDEGVRTLATWQLESDGHRVSQAVDGRAALAAIRADRPDLVVLDLSMPGVGGLDVLSTVRGGDAATADTPIIVLSGRDGETDRIVGLDLGADDYLVKPFSPRELAARVRCLLRRAGPVSPTVAADAVAVDPGTREVHVAGRAVDLTAREFDLLAFLVRHPRQVFSRTQLLARVWGDDTAWTGEATVTEHVHRLRHKLGTGADDRPGIRTLRGVGYQWDP